jgi:hypothetical protein
MKKIMSDQNEASRLVLFLTQEASADVPGADSSLACLLPLGPATFLERLMDSCALAGIREIDLVVSEQPERLRATLLDGVPWGISLHWHHAKESALPYKVLRGMQLRPQQHLVIGHGHQWVSSRVLLELMKTPAVAVLLNSDVAWTGWFSIDGAAIASLRPHLDYSSLTSQLRKLACADTVTIVAAHEYSSAESVRTLLVRTVLTPSSTRKPRCEGLYLSDPVVSLKRMQSWGLVPFWFGMCLLLPVQR